MSLSTRARLNVRVADGGRLEVSDARDDGHVILAAETATGKLVDLALSPVEVAQVATWCLRHLKRNPWGAVVVAANGQAPASWARELDASIDQSLAELATTAEGS